MTPSNKIEAFHKKRIPKQFTHHYALLIVMTLFTMTLITGCSNKEKTKSLTEGGMKCGAGKCGASMVDGSAVLVKKKLNILNQIEKDDYRRTCVLEAKTTKALYNCVRDPDTGRLTLSPKETNATTFQSSITVEKKAPAKEKNTTMKCQTGKCSGGK